MSHDSRLRPESGLEECAYSLWQRLPSAAPPLNEQPSRDELLGALLAQAQVEWHMLALPDMWLSVPISPAAVHTLWVLPQQLCSVDAEAAKCALHWDDYLSVESEAMPVLARRLVPLRILLRVAAGAWVPACQVRPLPCYARLMSTIQQQRQVQD
eukprot:17810-Heterococcus_DN1.PRE.2